MTTTSVTYRSSATNLWSIIFQLQGSVLCAVLPYCLVNCCLLAVVLLLAKNGVDIAFSPTGHELMTLIISFLVISKVNLGYERFMAARTAIADALATLRELNQLAATYSDHDQTQIATQWREEGCNKIVDLMDCTINVIKNEEQAMFLARNEGISTSYSNDIDPLVLAQSLRIHLYTGSYIIDHPLELLERVKLGDLLHEFLLSYRILLKLASTPLPLPLLQMGRTFLFLWTFSMPLVLRSPFGDTIASMIFLFFLTYGFVGLELVGMQMMSPFGDGLHDLNVSGMREATIAGIQHDKMASEIVSQSVSQRRLQHHGISSRFSGSYSAGMVGQHQDSSNTMYQAMPSH